MSENAHAVIIDDEEGNRDGFSRALSKVGWKVRAFAEAEPAFDYLRRNRDVALVITDLMMPGTDGFGVLRSAREIDADVGKCPRP